jgi:hypothetical protein
MPAARLGALFPCQPCPQAPGWLQLRFRSAVLETHTARPWANELGAGPGPSRVSLAAALRSPEVRVKRWAPQGLRQPAAPIEVPGSADYVSNRHARKHSERPRARSAALRTGAVLYSVALRSSYSESAGRVTATPPRRLLMKGRSRAQLTHEPSLRLSPCDRAYAERARLLGQRQSNRASPWHRIFLSVVGIRWQ